MLAWTALLSAFGNLDVAVVVAMPLALTIAGIRGLEGSRMVIAVAVMANAASFLTPTANVTNLLVFTSVGVTPVSYLSAAWMAWLLVVIVTLVALCRFVDVGTAAVGSRSVEPRFSLPGIVRDLLIMFTLASALRALLPGGLGLGRGFAPEALGGAVLAATVNNLVAAAAVHPVTVAGAWGAVLAMAIGPNLLVTGSVATMICRRIARGSGSDLDAVRFTKLGLVLVPLQLLVGWLGLALVGVVAH